MAEKVVKEPQGLNKERDSFLADLQRFHQNRGTPFAHFPTVRGKEVDLYLLYTRVTAAGGWEKINAREGAWELLSEEFHLPEGCTNSDQALKRIYIRYLDIYERIHFRGEDPDKQDEYEDTGDTPSHHRNKRRCPVGGVALRYNYQQHKIPNFAREQYGLSMDFVPLNSYSKLERCLESGLPNEVDFAFNICTLLSNEGKHTMQLKDSPHMLEVLLAHVGIYNQEGGLRLLHDEGWKCHTKRNFLRFWHNTVESVDHRKFILPEDLTAAAEALTNPRHSPDLEAHVEDVLNLGNDMGMQDKEGQRVMQLAMIFRNLSFEKSNMFSLSSSTLVLRFLVLCIHSTYGNLKQLALDTLSNMALQMALKPVRNPETRIMLHTVANAISSADKFEIISGLDMMSRLCQVEANEDILSEALDVKVYENIVSYLTVHDIQLIVYTLECLYQLSELGEMTTTHIAQVNQSVATLVSLVTIEAQSYGPESIRGIKVVEHVPTDQLVAGGIPPIGLGMVKASPAGTPIGLASSGISRPPAVPTPPLRPMMTATPPPPAAAATLVHSTMTPPQQPPRPSSQPPIGTSPLAAQSQPPQVQDVDSLACNWLRAHFAFDLGQSGTALFSRMELYSEYLSGCGKYGMNAVPNFVSFFKCVNVTFPTMETTKVDKPDGSHDFHYRGLLRKSMPDSFQVKAAPNPAAHNAMKPPMAGRTLFPPGGQPQVPSSMSRPPGAAPSQHPGQKQDSTLIKSLLANKLALNMQKMQQQLHQSPALPTNYTNQPPQHHLASPQGTNTTTNTGRTIQTPAAATSVPSSALLLQPQSHQPTTTSADVSSSSSASSSLSSQETSQQEQKPLLLQNVTTNAICSSSSSSTIAGGGGGGGNQQPSCAAAATTTAPLDNTTSANNPSEIKCEPMECSHDTLEVKRERLEVVGQGPKGDGACVSDTTTPVATTVNGPAATVYNTQGSQLQSNNLAAGDASASAADAAPKCVAMETSDIKEEKTHLPLCNGIPDSPNPSSKPPTPLSIQDPSEFEQSEVSSTNPSSRGGGGLKTPPVKSPSIEAKKARIAQLMQDTKIYHDAKIYHDQIVNGITHVGNGECQKQLTENGALLCGSGGGAGDDDDNVAEPMLVNGCPPSPPHSNGSGTSPPVNGDKKKLQSVINQTTDKGSTMDTVVSQSLSNCNNLLSKQQGPISSSRDAQNLCEQNIAEQGQNPPKPNQSNAYELPGQVDGPADPKEDADVSSNPMVSNTQETAAPPVTMGTEAVTSNPQLQQQQPAIQQLQQETVQQHSAVMQNQPVVNQPVSGAITAAPTPPPQQQQLASSQPASSTPSPMSSSQAPVLAAPPPGQAATSLPLAAQPPVPQPQVQQQTVPQQQVAGQLNQMQQQQQFSNQMPGGQQPSQLMGQVVSQVQLQQPPQQVVNQQVQQQQHVVINQAGQVPQQQLVANNQMGLVQQQPILNQTGQVQQQQQMVVNQMGQVQQQQTVVNQVQQQQPVVNQIQQQQTVVSQIQQQPQQQMVVNQTAGQIQQQMVNIPVQQQQAVQQQMLSQPGQIQQQQLQPQQQQVIGTQPGQQVMQQQVVSQTTQQLVQQQVVGQVDQTGQQQPTGQQQLPLQQQQHQLQQPPSSVQQPQNVAGQLVPQQQQMVTQQIQQQQPPQMLPQPVATTQQVVHQQLPQQLISQPGQVLPQQVVQQHVQQQPQPVSQPGQIPQQQQQQQVMQQLVSQAGQLQQQVIMTQAGQMQPQQQIVNQPAKVQYSIGQPAGQIQQQQMLVSQDGQLQQQQQQQQMAVSQSQQQQHHMVVSQAPAAAGSVQQQQQVVTSQGTLVQQQAVRQAVTQQQQPPQQHLQVVGQQQMPPQQQQVVMQQQQQQQPLTTNIPNQLGPQHVVIQQGGTQQVVQLGQPIMHSPTGHQPPPRSSPHIVQQQQPQQQQLALSQSGGGGQQQVMYQPPQTVMSNTTASRQQGLPHAVQQPPPPAPAPAPPKPQPHVAPPQPVQQQPQQQVLQVQVPPGQQVMQVRMPPSNGQPQLLHVHVPQGPGHPPHVMQVTIPPAPNGQAQTVQVQVRPQSQAQQQHMIPPPPPPPQSQQQASSSAPRLAPASQQQHAPPLQQQQKHQHLAPQSNISHHQVPSTSSAAHLATQSPQMRLSQHQQQQPASSSQPHPPPPPSSFGQIRVNTTMAAQGGVQQHHPILQHHLKQPPSPTKSVSSSPLPSPSGNTLKRPTPAPSPLSGQLGPSSAKRKRPSKKSKRTDSLDSNQSGSSQSQGSLPSPALPQQPTTPYLCEWAGCKKSFDNHKAAQKHGMEEHFTVPDVNGKRYTCLWEGCDGVPRGKFSFVQHLQDRHLSEQAMKGACLRRQHLPAAPVVAPSIATSTASTTGATAGSSQPSPAPPCYPEDAAVQAIRRFAHKPPYPELMESKEGPVTKHIRLTAALILRNMARYSAHGRSLIKQHEQHLAYVALSSVEASTALSNCLFELHKVNSTPVVL